MVRYNRPVELHRFVKAALFGFETIPLLGKTLININGTWWMINKGVHKIKRSDIVHPVTKLLKQYYG